MKHVRVNQTVGAVGIVAMCLFAAPVLIQAAVIHVPADYATIQGAVTAANPGDTILVAPGTYTESQIVIDKALNVEGAGSSSTTIDGGNAALSVGGLVRITAPGDVRFSGFTLENAGADSEGNSFELYASSPVAGNTYMITQNRIVGSDNLGENEFGVYAQGGLETFIFRHNEVTNTANNAVLIEANPGPTDISYNILQPGAGGPDAIFTMTYGGLDITTVQRRSDNFIDLSQAGGATGITFAGAYLGSQHPGDEGTFSHIQIMRNLIENVHAFQRGISLWNNASSSLPSGGDMTAQVVGNVVFGAGTDPTDSKGIQVIGRITGARLIHNGLANLEDGIHLRSWNSGSPVGAKLIANRFQADAHDVVSDTGTTGTKEHASRDFVSP